MSDIAADFRWANLAAEKEFWAFCKQLEEMPIARRQPAWRLISDDFVAQHGGKYGRSTGTVLRCAPQ